MLFLNALARVTRKFHPRGLHRLLRLIPWESEDVVTLNGVKVYAHARYDIGWSAYWFGEYEPWVAAELRRFLKAGDCAIDVGANAGFHSVLMSHLIGSTGTVIAVEPDQDAILRLYKNTRQLGNAWIVSGKMGMAQPCAGFWSVYQSLGFPYVGLIKIDVDGIEPAVLKELDPIIQRDHPALVFECALSLWKEAGYDLSTTNQWLDERGYRLWGIHGINAEGTRRWQDVKTDSDMLAVHRVGD